MKLIWNVSNEINESNLMIINLSNLSNLINSEWNLIIINNRQYLIELI